LDIGAQYWIVRLAKDYSYSVVSSPNYRYLWILYRQPVMPENLYNQIYADLKKDGFPVEKLVRTQQWRINWWFCMVEEFLYFGWKWMNMGTNLVVGEVLIGDFWKIGNKIDDFENSIL